MTAAVGGRKSVPDRARNYISRMPASIQGSGGSVAAFNVAKALVVGFKLATDEAMELMQEWNQSCEPPWSDAELLHKLENARAKANGEPGYLLNGDRMEGHHHTKLQGPRRNMTVPAGRQNQDHTTQTDSTKRVHDSVEKAIQAQAWAAERKGQIDTVRNPDSTWMYRYADGTEAFMTLRWNVPGGKVFRQITKVPDGWISGGLKGNRPILNLPSIIQSETVWVLEGEKSADYADSLGLMATSPSQGALSPQLSDWSILAGKRVIILPDNDSTGKQFAAKIVSLIRQQAPGATVEVKLLSDDWPSIPEGGDIADWSEHNDSQDAESLRARLDELPNKIGEFENPEVETPDSTIPNDDSYDADSESCSLDFETFSAWDLIDTTVELDEVIVEGIIRRGEVSNIIASTKVGKSWLALGLGYSVATGKPWLGRTTKKGNVLLVDNELRPKVLRHRLKLVAESMSIKQAEDNCRMDAVALRGQFAAITQVETALRKYKPGELSMVILDAKYRFFGQLDENNNSDQTMFHNLVDRIANDLDCALVLIHHATKGDQGSKSVTDVGSGGGAQARAVDTHLILRPHIEENFAVLDAACRSFAPVAPQTIQWEFPLWHLASSVEPNLKVEQSRGDSRQEAKDLKALCELTAIMHQADGAPLTRYELHKKFGGGFDRINRLIRLGLSDGRIVQTGVRDTRNGPAEEYTLKSYLQPAESEIEFSDTRLF